MKRVRNSAEFQKARERLGMTKVDVATIMQLPNPEHSGRVTVARWEGSRVNSNDKGAPGPAKVLMEALLSGWRPLGWKGK